MPSNASLILSPRTRQSTSVGVSPHPSASQPPPALPLPRLRAPPPAPSGGLTASVRTVAALRPAFGQLRRHPGGAPPHLHPPQDARRGPQGAAAPRRTNAAVARHGPATAPVRLRPPPSWRFILAHSRSSDGSAYGRVRSPLAQGGTKRPPRSPSEMGAAGPLPLANSTHLLLHHVTGTPYLNLGFPDDSINCIGQRAVYCAMAHDIGLCMDAVEYF
ncbi:unnamed protein product [Miscanthus lutarioriparius]|uniref:Uncharacterized protein n=1 Tax=Miscanthus lutarioriparius TaxID=422564 RepID=A0A811MVZ3_9POAL|nr:unnamed protein product [Miscanthus lutarioriparius]